MPNSHWRLWALLAASVAVAGIIILAPSAPARAPSSVEYTREHPELAGLFTEDRKWNDCIVRMGRTQKFPAKQICGWARDLTDPPDSAADIKFANDSYNRTHGIR